MVDKYKVKVGDVLFDNKNKKYVTITEIDLTSYLCLGYKDTDMSYWMGAASTYDYKCKYKNIMQIDKNNWQIKVNEENREELEDYFIPKSSFLYFRLVINNWYGYIDGEMIAENDRTPYLKCIDIYQFRKYILGKEDRKIIGYKAPFDMGNGEIKEGDVFIIDLEETDDWYIRKFDRSFGFPKELVESYFIPVYEEEEKVIELHGYRISKDKITICDGNINIEIEDFKYLTNIRNEVLKAYEELNK